MRTFAQCPINLWREARFKALSLPAKVALYFFWAGPHSSSAGVSVVFDGYASLDLGWPEAEWVSAREELEAAGFIERDPATETVMVLNYFKANRPSSQRHLAAIHNQIASLECVKLKAKAGEALSALQLGASATANQGGVTPQLKALLGANRFGGSA